MQISERSIFTSLIVPGTDTYATSPLAQYKKTPFQIYVCFLLAEAYSGKSKRSLSCALECF
jgi:hypothetical protein